jgi:hypothetical protein
VALQTISKEIVDSNSVCGMIGVQTHSRGAGPSECIFCAEQGLHATMDAINLFNIVLGVILFPFDRDPDSFQLFQWAMVRQGRLGNDL